MRWPLQECLTNDFLTAISTFVVAFVALSCAKKPRSRGGGVFKVIGSYIIHEDSNKESSAGKEGNKSSTNTHTRNGSKELKKTKQCKERKTSERTNSKQCPLKSADEPQIKDKNANQAKEKIKSSDKERGNRNKDNSKHSADLPSRNTLQCTQSEGSKIQRKEAKNPNQSIITQNIDNRLTSNMANTSLATQKLDSRLMSTLMGGGSLRTEIVDARLKSDMKIVVHNIKNDAGRNGGEVAAKI